ncbi:MAG: phage portal protein [Elusimicrobia bacterium]|nr:phage portal protein [Elusimicrobiota bacterium]
MPELWLLLEVRIMNIRERIVKALFGGLIQEEIQKSSKQVVTHVPGLSLTEGILPEIDFEIFNQMYEQTSWVRAVVGVICKAVTARGYALVPSKPNADPKNAETLQEFFSNCNPNDTFLEILDDVARDVYVFGSGFLEVVYGSDGKPRELWNLDATTVRVKADDHGSIMGYIQMPRFSSTRNQTGKVEFEPKEVIHFKLGTKGATLYGLSPLASLILPITVDKFAQVYNRAFFINGAKIRGAFIMKDATPEQVERNREYMKARAQNPDLSHSDLVLEGDIEFKQISTNQKDMEFLELREFTRNEILAVYGVPPGKVSIIETGNIGAGTGEHQTQTFYEETILPFQMRVAEKITKHVIRQGFGITDWAFQFNKRSIDEKDQAEIFNIYLQNGVFSPEEVRRLVAPRMPEIQKSLSGNGSHEIGKGKLKPSETIVNATKEVVAIENRFVDALGRLFREIKSAVASKLPDLRLEIIRPKISSLNLPIKNRTVSVFLEGLEGIFLRFDELPEEAKQLDELEVLLELIDQEKIARLLEKFSLEAARKGLNLSARRAKLENVEDLTRALEESLRSNAAILAGHVSEALKASLRQALIEGIAASETIPQLMRRIEDQLDSVATVSVRPTLDAQGNVLRAGHTRQMERSTAAEIIARTEANRAFNEGNLDALSQAEIQRVQWLLASDACPQCVAAAEILAGNKLGKVLSIDEASGQIPVHPNCRCTWITEVER